MPLPLGPALRGALKGAKKGAGRQSDEVAGRVADDTAGKHEGNKFEGEQSRSDLPIKPRSMHAQAKEKDGIVTVSAQITHPMETGLRKDENGVSIPAHFIKEVAAETRGETVFVANLSTCVSENPYLEFKYHGAKGDLLTLRWEDNRGERGVGQWRVG